MSAFISSGFKSGVIYFLLPSIKSMEYTLPPISYNAVTMMFRHFLSTLKSNPEHSMKTSFVFSDIFPVLCEFIIGGTDKTSSLASLKTGNFFFPSSRCPYSFPAGCCFSTCMAFISFANSKGWKMISSGFSALNVIGVFIFS